VIARVLPAPRRLDLIVLGCVLSLAVLGILFVASATSSGTASARLHGLAARQALWIAVGLGLMCAAVLVDYRTLLKISFPLYLASLVPLIYLLAFGQRIANVRSWIRFGAFQFQPAELTKIATALLVAYLFENEDDARLRLSAFVKLGTIVGVPFLLIFAQPDLGLALTLLPLLAVGFFFGGLPWRGWVAIFLVVAIVAGGAWFFLKDYQKQRIATFLNPDQDTLKAGYQVRQSKIAVGSGGFSGKGFRSGTQGQLRFLPTPQTDFIFAVVAEEWGFLGVILVLGLFATLVLRCLRLASVARDRGGVFLTLSLTAMLFFSVTVNTSMMIGLLPTTGIPLPLVSYGGSSVATTFLSIGLILGVGYRRFANA
jgi:rod shape determining protein RodA